MGIQIWNVSTFYTFGNMHLKPSTMNNTSFVCSTTDRDTKSLEKKARGEPFWASILQTGTLAYTHSGNNIATKE